MELASFNKMHLFSINIDGDHWVRAVDVKHALEYSEKTCTADVLKKHCSRENYVQKCKFKGSVAATDPLEWPSNIQPSEYFLNEQGMYEWVFGSQQPKAKAFRNYCCNKLFPQIRQQLQKQKDKNHQQAITERDTRIRAIEHDNMGLQGEIRAKDQEIVRRQEEIRDLIANRYVPRSASIDTVLCFIDKGEPDEEHQYYVIRCQQRSLEKHKKMLKNRYPDMVVLDQCDDPNSVHSWCRFRKDIIEDFYKNHFNLTEEAKDTLEAVFNVDLD